MRRSQCADFYLITFEISHESVPEIGIKSRIHETQLEDQKWKILLSN